MIPLPHDRGWQFCGTETRAGALDLLIAMKETAGSFSAALWHCICMCCSETSGCPGEGFRQAVHGAALNNIKHMVRNVFPSQFSTSSDQHLPDPSTNQFSLICFLGLAGWASCWSLWPPRVSSENSMAPLLFLSYLSLWFPSRMAGGTNFLCVAGIYILGTKIHLF